MKKVGLWVLAFFIGLLAIPMSWMIKNGMPFNVVTNAFFNSSTTTTAFYILQWLLVIIETEIIIESYNTCAIENFQWMNVFMLIAFVCSDFYLYYLVLALYAFIAMLVTGKKRNKLKDDLTRTLEDVKEEYTHQEA